MPRSVTLGRVGRASSRGRDQEPALFELLDVLIGLEEGSIGLGDALPQVLGRGWSGV